MIDSSTPVIKAVAAALLEAELRGYQRGWDECAAALVAAASQKRAAGDTPIRKSPTKAGEGEPYSVIVFRALTVKPGMSNPEIEAWLTTQKQPHNKHGIRSAVRRLKRQGRIEQRGIRYWPKAERAQEAA